MLLQHMEHVGRAPLGLDFSQRVQVLVQRLAQAVKRRELRHMRIEMAHELLAQSIEICSTAQGTVQAQQIQVRHRRGFLMLGNVLAQHLHGLVVFAHGHEKLCLLLNIEQLFWIDDVVQWCLRCWCSRGGRFKTSVLQRDFTGLGRIFCRYRLHRRHGRSHGRGRSGGQGTTPAVCRRCNHLFHSFQIDHTWLVSPSTADRHGLTP